MISAWLNRDVALAHRAVVEKQLASPDLSLPYNVFVEIMRELNLPKGTTLLDIGCGAGAYGVLCERYFPNIEYHGTDSSEHMIEFAREICPMGKFNVVPLNENDLDYSVVLASSVIQYSAGWDSLSFLIDNIQDYLILHRIPVTSESSHIENSYTYCENREYSFVWNTDEIRNFIKDRALILWERVWDTGMMTFVAQSTRKK